jgi:copper chaperone CopZ
MDGCSVTNCSLDVFLRERIGTVLAAYRCGMSKENDGREGRNAEEGHVGPPRDMSRRRKPMSQVKGRLLRWAIIAGFLFGALLVASAEAQEAQEAQEGQGAQLDIRDVTLKLGGPSCADHVERAEAALLKVRGVVMVDIEKKKGHVIVGYDAAKVSVPQLLQAVGKARGDNWSCTAQHVGS